MVDELLAEFPHDRVAQFLLEEIQGGRLRSDGRLPTERNLAERLVLSRTAVRRSLAHLEARALITRRVGRGTFLEPRGHNRQGEVGAPLDTSPVEVMSVRLLLEPQIAHLAATFATNRDFERMRHCLVQGEAATTLIDFETWDSALHSAIADATQNTFLVRLFRTMNAVRHEPMWGTLKKRSLTSESRRAAEQEHGAIVDAVCDRDGELAQRLSREHLLRVRRSLLGDNA